MKFSELTEQVRAWLQRQGRVSYRALKREFELDDDDLADLKAELIDAQRVAIDEDGKVLVWAQEQRVGSKEQGARGESRSASEQLQGPKPALSLVEGSEVRSQEIQPLTPNSQPPAAERRQLTVMFCDLVGSTALSERLDPEDYREVIQAYNEVCATAIQRFDGHLAKYLGDGLLVYFGYPVAHEDDAQRAVRAGLEITEALRHEVPSPRQGEGQGEVCLQVRIGIHTGLVVAGEMGAGETREPLAIVGETPNLAARLQALAEPDTVVISAATQRLVDGFFTLRDLGFHSLKGLSILVAVYEVQGESGIHSRFELAVTTGLTPLVGREEEIGVLEKRWEQVKAGEGQVVLLRGEAGIGKSRLARVVRERAAVDRHAWLTVRSSPYYQNSAFYPVINVLQRALSFRPDDTPEEKLGKLGNAILRTGMNLEESLPLLASLLALPSTSLSLPSLTPQKLREKTLHTLVSLLLEETKLRPVLVIWEDLHWTDPSSLEFVNLLIEQAPTARLLMLLTCRPEFTPAWAMRSHVTHLTLGRLGRTHVEAMIGKVIEDKVLPSEAIQQIVTKADGVPLFVEELTKNIVESVGATGRSPLQLGIPVTLQDALMARLDRLGEAKEVAQLSATLGREFSYELLHAVSSLDESALQQALGKLVESELLYQRGLLPQAQYVFKHALIQDTAYQSLLKSTRQKYHTQIVQVLEDRFAELKETQPELLAHHYTEAAFIEQAIPYWQQAGQRAAQRSANVEAIAHLNKGLELLKTLPDTPERAQQELTLQITLGVPLVVIKGSAAPEVEKTYARARELCQQVGEPSQVFPALWGLWMFHGLRADLQTAHQLGEQLLTLAQRIQDSALLLQAHHALWTTSVSLGELVLAREHAEQGVTLYNPHQHRSHALFYGGHDPGVCCRDFAAWVLWLLGYPEQALERSQEALTLARELSYAHSLAYALGHGSIFHQLRREGQATQELAEALMTLSTDQGFPLPLARGIILRGWALVEQGQTKEGIVQLCQGLAAYQATGSKMFRPHFLALLSEAYKRGGQVEEGLGALAEALATVEKTGECYYEAELYRIKGELMLQQFKVQGSKFNVENPQSAFSNPQLAAEECFLKAIDIARKQQAKSLELRATTSLARLWQQQALQQGGGSTEQGAKSQEQGARSKLKEAHRMLSEVYNWFTEGFDTKDLQEAKTLLEELSH